MLVHVPLRVASSALRSTSHLSSFCSPSRSNTVTSRTPLSTTYYSPSTRMCTTSSSAPDTCVVDSVLTFWYGTSDIQSRDMYVNALSDRSALWYGASSETDARIRDEFGEVIDASLNGQLNHLITSEDSSVQSWVALCVLLDQFPRNVFRGSARAFDGDSVLYPLLERHVLAEDKWAKVKREVPPLIRMAFLLPLMHQESKDAQRECVNKVGDMIDEYEKFKDGEDGKDEEMMVEYANVLRKSLEFAKVHADIIDRFGRFPYRNAALGRTSTPDEMHYIEHGERFGQ